MDKHTFTLDELAALVELPRRTVRYYIQEGLLDRPSGAGRGAHYGPRHLEQLLEIRKWQRAGLSLERIRELLIGDSGADAPLPPPRRRRTGSLEVWSHLVVDEGVEVLIDPKQAGLSPEQVRSFVGEVMSLYHRIRNQGE
jgi:DNA-binding transcriptional MerR regulator